MVQRAVKTVKTKCQVLVKGFQVLLSQKLGRCSVCLRLSFSGSLALWLTYALMSFWNIPFVVRALALILAVSLTSLWLVHVGTFTWRGILRVVLTRRVLLQVKRLLPQFKPEGEVIMLPLNRREILGMCLRRVAGVVLLSLPFVNSGCQGGNGRREPAGRIVCLDCDCYFSCDCPSNQTCDYNATCTQKSKPMGPCPDTSCNGVTVGNCDGMCISRSQGAPWQGVDPLQVAQATDFYFQAYRVAVEKVGEPDPELLRQAQSIPLPGTWHQELHRFVRNALFEVLAKDFVFVFPPSTEAVPCPVATSGKVVAVSDMEAAKAIVDATRQGFVKAILQNDPEAITLHLVEFWQRFPNYRPVNPWHCYPHGHDEGVFMSMIVCQLVQQKHFAALNARRLA